MIADLDGYLFVGDLQQVQDHSVSPHVLQQSLQLQPVLLIHATHPTEALQDLIIEDQSFLVKY